MRHPRLHLYHAKEMHVPVPASAPRRGYVIFDRQGNQLNFHRMPFWHGSFDSPDGLQLCFTMTPENVSRLGSAVQQRLLGSEALPDDPEAVFFARTTPDYDLRLNLLSLGNP